MKHLSFSLTSVALVASHDWLHQLQHTNRNRGLFGLPRPMLRQTSRSWKRPTASLPLGGKVVFQNGTYSQSKLHYNVVTGEIEYIDDKQDTLALGNLFSIKPIQVWDAVSLNDQQPNTSTALHTGDLAGFAFACSSIRLLA